MFGIGPMELVLILVVALLVLGPKRMPELARTLGKGLGEFRRASNDLRQSLALDEIQNELRDGLTGAGTIHKPVKKPEADDRPAQAGDEMAAGADRAHPGELPDDLDSHAHAEGASEKDPVTESASNAPEPDPMVESADDVSEPAPPSPSAADDGLGAVPVGRTATPRRTAEPAAETDEERG